MRRHTLLTASLLCLSTAAVALPPVEAYVAPPSLFAPEGAYGDQEPQPLPVYDSTRQRVVGKIQARKGCDKEGCSWIFELTLPSGDTDRIEIDEWSYETNGIVVRSPPVPSVQGQTWSRLDSPLGQFWLRTAAEHVHRYEELVSVVEEPAVWCTRPGQCVKVSYSVAHEMRRVAQKSSCSGNPYEVKGVVTEKGKRYYRLSLPEPLPEGVSTWLPKEAFVPVRDARGEHTGTFSPRGC